MHEYIHMYIYMHVCNKVSAPINYPLTRHRLTSLRANLFVLQLTYVYPAGACTSWSLYNFQLRAIHRPAAIGLASTCQWISISSSKALYSRSLFRIQCRILKSRQIRGKEIRCIDLCEYTFKHCTFYVKRYRLHFYLSDGYFYTISRSNVIMWYAIME